METTKKSKKSEAATVSAENNNNVANNNDKKDILNSDIYIDDENIQNCLHSLKIFKEQIALKISDTSVPCSIHVLERLKGELRNTILTNIDQLMNTQISKLDEQKLIIEKKKEFKEKGIILRTNARSSRTIITEYGPIQLTRYSLIPKNDIHERKLVELGYKDTIIPVDEYLGIDKLPYKVTVNMMLEIAFWAQNQCSYEATERIIKKIHYVNINNDLIRKITNHIGDIIYNKDTEKSILEYNSLLNGTAEYRKPDNDHTLYIEIDGAAINTRTKTDVDSSWKENKLCVVYSSDNISYSKNKETGERYHRINKREYISFIGKACDFKKYVYYCALKNGLYKYKNIILISDGAPWIRYLKDDLFPQAQQILDFFHLIENLYAYAKAYFNYNEDKYIPWVTKYKNMFKHGYHLQAVNEISKLKVKKLDKGVVNINNYLKNNIDNINYKSYLDNNWFIGSGAIESGNKVVLQKRLKGAGMRWDVSSAQRMLTLKAKNESDLWFKEVISQVLEHYGLNTQ
jgi:hypothetical protein